MRSLIEIFSSLVEAPTEETIRKIQSVLIRAGGKPYIVGGAVRDEMLPGAPPSKDIDFLVTGLTLKQIAQTLSSLGTVNEVGKSFGVVKATIDGEEFDFAIPRTAEKKTGAGHADVEVELDPHTSPESDLSRRDFTFNALAKDVSGKVIDLFGGQEDIKRKLIRAVGEPKERFEEDPLRILRAVQFAVRFGFKIEPKTAAAMKQMKSKLTTVADERTLEEFSKAWIKGADPAHFIKLLDEFDIGKTLFGSDFDPVPIKFTGTDEEKVLAGFVSFFLNGGNIKKIRATNEMKRHLQLARGALSDAQVWQFANHLDRDKIPLVSKVLLDIDKEAAKKMEDSLNLPLSGQELKVSGQDLMRMGFKGRDIGNAQRSLLAAIHSGKMKNDRQDIEKQLGKPQREGLSLMEVTSEVMDYQIYCDMDGVLVNFQKGLPEYVNDFLGRADPRRMSPKTLKNVNKAVQELSGDFESGEIPDMTFKDFEKSAGKKKLRNLSYALIKKADVDFWLNLEWMPDGKQLWAYIKKYNPTILSSPVGEARGKIEWCKRNLGIPENRIILSHDKHEYARYNTILIDDMEKNTVPFGEKGGIPILHKSAASTIQMLKSMGL